MCIKKTANFNKVSLLLLVWMDERNVAKKKSGQTSDVSDEWKYKQTRASL